MSHIFEDIRNDAVKLMDLWVSLAPEVVVSRFWNRVSSGIIPCQKSRDLSPLSNWLGGGYLHEPAFGVVDQ